MRSIKSVLVALVAVLALGAVAASGASAHEYYIEGKSMKELGLTEESISFAATSHPTEFGAEGIEVTCHSGALSGVIKAGGTGTAKFTDSECEVTAPANCSVERQPVVFETNSSLVEVGAGKLIDEFTIVGSESAALDLGGVCDRVWPLEGYIGSNAISEAENVTLKLGTSGFENSEVKLGGNAGYLKTGLSVKLSGANAGKKWSARK